MSPRDQQLGEWQWGTFEIHGYYYFIFWLWKFVLRLLSLKRVYSDYLWIRKYVDEKCITRKQIMIHVYHITMVAMFHATIIVICEKIQYHKRKITITLLNISHFADVVIQIFAKRTLLTAPCEIIIPIICLLLDRP